MVKRTAQHQERGVGTSGQDMQAGVRCAVGVLVQVESQDVFANGKVGIVEIVRNVPAQRLHEHIHTISIITLRECMLSLHGHKLKSTHTRTHHKELLQKR